MKRRISWAILFVFIGGLLGSCGQKASPQGGPRDEKPPEVADTDPRDSTLNFSGNSMRFSFNETIRKPTYGKEVFISPFIERPKITRSDNAKRLKIDIEEELRPQTTYLITLNGIQDLNEGNAMEETYVLAFSTGDQLDSMEIKGAIFSPEIGKAPEKMTVFLFDPDSIRRDSFTNVRPAYITKSDENGDFSFKYLRNTPYRVLGVKDEDQSNTYNNPLEKIAINPDSLVSFDQDSTNFTTVKLYAFQPDNKRPALQTSAWISDSTLRLRFNKGLRVDSLELYVSDTLRVDSQEIETFTYFQEEKIDLLLHLPRSEDSLRNIHLYGLSDSLGRKLDTLISVPRFPYDSSSQTLLSEPKLLVEEGAWEFVLPRRYRKEMDYFILTDTAKGENRDSLDLEVRQEGFKVKIAPATPPDSLMPFYLFASRALRATRPRDSVKYSRYTLDWFDPSSFGTLSGAVRVDSPFAPPIVLQLLNEQKKIVRTAFDTTFSFAFLPAGNYSTRIILDRDSNQVWTPGNLKERRLPEQIFTPTGGVEIRENWDYEDYEVIVGKASAREKQETQQSESLRQGNKTGDKEKEEGRKPGLPGIPPIKDR